MTSPKSPSDDRFVSEESVLHAGLLVISRFLLPSPPSYLIHPHDRTIASTRPRSSLTRLRRTLRRWNDDFGSSCLGNIVYRKSVIGRVRRDAPDVALDFSEQVKSCFRIVNIPVGQDLGDDRTRSIHTKMKLPPATPAAASILGGGPLSFANDGQPCAIDNQMYGLIRWDPMQIGIEVMATTRESCVIWGFKSQLHQRQYRSQKALRLAQWQIEDEPQRQSCLDRLIRELFLGTSPAGRCRFPRGNRVF